MRRKDEQSAFVNYFQDSQENRLLEFEPFLVPSTQLKRPKKNFGRGSDPAEPDLTPKRVTLHAHLKSPAPMLFVILRFPQENTFELLGRHRGRHLRPSLLMLCVLFLDMSPKT